MVDEGLTSEGRRHFLLLHEQAHDNRGITKSMHVYRNWYGNWSRSRQTAFEVGVFLQTFSELHFGELRAFCRVVSILQTCEHF